MTEPDKKILPSSILRAIGLMSGTSLDGIDAAIIETDGLDYISTGSFLTLPYNSNFRTRLRGILGTRGDRAVAHEIAEELTHLHATAVKILIDKAGLTKADIDVIGFHGHTIFHDPANRFTRQIGDGALLAKLTGIRVVNDMRSADVAAGGQGAPLVPLYHDAMAKGLERPLATVNIGGIANVAYLSDGDPIAFDAGPGNALIDDLFLKRTGLALDYGGQTAADGKIDEAALAQLMDHPYFSAPIPKSLDRDAFDVAPIAHLSLEDAAATLVMFTAKAIAQSVSYFPQMPKYWLVCGGGRHNNAIMQCLRDLLNVPVQPVEDVGWNADMMEGQTWGYLAVRALKGLPLTLPTTTGVPHPLTGGVLHAA